MDENQNKRRDFLKGAALVLAGIGSGVTAVSLLTGCAQQPEKKTRNGKLAIRRNIADQAIDAQEVKVFKEAVAILKKRSQRMPLDPMGWEAHSMLHATFCATSVYANQVHYNWYVWPWHRLYLWSMEQKLQQAVNEPTLALHYWDWTKKPYIPAHYWGDEINPLFNATRLVTATDPIPADFINLQSAFRTHHYKTFGGYPAVTDPAQGQMDGMAEQTFHNNVHNWVGGQMATFTESGFDPLFYGHHGNCDRIWAAWQKHAPENRLPSDPDWLDKKLYATDGQGKPVEFRIRELLDTTQLGYDFEDLDVLANQSSLPDLPARIPTGSDCKAQLQVAPELEAALGDYASGKNANAILHFERAQLPYHPYCARVYFEWKKESGLTAVYSGTFTILPIQGMDSLLLQHGVFLQLELSQTVFEALKDGLHVEVALQPVPLPNREVPSSPLVVRGATLKPIG
ncbi:MAG TPA: tyrosinase family protein [Flavobacterium sp.]|nr:tyrosinase family protein [Flavobacterium sp.]